MPSVATLRKPKRPTSAPAAGPLKLQASISGSINSPASSGVKPWTNCSSCAISSSNPTRVIIAVSAISTPVKIMRWVNSVRSIIGALARSWLRINSAISNPPLNNAPSTSVRLLFAFRLVFAASTSSRIAAISISAWVKFRVWARCIGWRGMQNVVNSSTRAIIGKLIKNTDPQ